MDDGGQLPGSRASDVAVEVIAADVGGTFTDVIVGFGDGSTSAVKILSTRPAYEQAILAAASELTGDRSIVRLAHGTTVATNALLESKGAATALVTTAGFGDVLELARLRRPALFDLGFVKPPPLVPRRWRYEIEERTAADGTCLVEPSHDQVGLLAARLVDAQVDAVAICFLNAYVNPHNEELVSSWLRDALVRHGRPLFVTASSEIQREIREFERTSTTVINAYVAPEVSRYLDRLRSGVRKHHRTEVVQIMQSNGSLMSGALAERFPCRLIESGPAAGVIAAAAAVADLNNGDAIAFDMGGTTAKAALIEAGQPFEATQLEVGSSMNRDGGSMSGSGYVIRAPSLDISEVGSGGGSIIWLDRTGAPRVGPESAGADPGPACYGRGGVEPTVTDANLLLGYLNPCGIADGRVRLRPDLAESALRDRIAGPLGMEVIEAAWGIHLLANVGMEGALRAVSVERGRSPAAYILVAYGGAGPMHAATLAATFGMTSVLVPPQAGLLCARGLMMARIRQDAVISYPAGDAIQARVLRSLLEDLRSSLLSLLGADAGVPEQVTFRWSLAVRYAGQSSELLIPIDPARDVAVESHAPNGGSGAREAIDGVLASLMIERFSAEHERTYGYADAHAPMEIVSVRGAASMRASTLEPAEVSPFDGSARSADAGLARDETSRPAYFGPDVGWIDTPVLQRRLAAEGRSGPLIIEEPDSTVVVPPLWSAGCDSSDRLLLRREGS